MGSSSGGIRYGVTIGETSSHHLRLQWAVVDEPDAWVIAVMDVESTGAQTLPDKTRRALSDQLRIFLAQRRLKVVRSLDERTTLSDGASCGG